MLDASCFASVLGAESECSAVLESSESEWVPNGSGNRYNSESRSPGTTWDSLTHS